MNSDRRARLAQLGLQLPEVSPPGGGYVPAVRHGNLVYVSGQVPMIDGKLVTTGKVGAEVTPEQARELTQRCALAALAAIDSVAGLDSVVQVVKVTGYIASAEGFAGQPGVHGRGQRPVRGGLRRGRAACPYLGRGRRTPPGSPVEVEVTVEVAD